MEQASEIHFLIFHGFRLSINTFLTKGTDFTDISNQYLAVHETIKFS